MPSAPAMPRAWRKAASRVRTRSGRTPPASSPRPVLSRHRIQRLARSFSCCWGMREKSRTYPALEAEAVHLPGVAGILGVPAAALGQVGDLPAGPGQQRDRVVLLAERFPPFLLGPVQQRGRPAGGQEPDHDHDDERRGLARALAGPPLERVLDLQPQLRGQAVHEDALMDGDRVVIEIPGGEAARFGTAVNFPRGAVGMAERDAALGPQAAEPDQAVLLAGRRDGHGDAGEPLIRIRASGTSPGRAVTHAQPLAADAAPAAGCPAAGQGFLLVPAGARRRDERVQVRPALSGPPVVVSGAQAPAAPRRPRAGSHPADRAPEYRVGGVEGDLAGTELGAHCGDELFQQARGSLVMLPGRLRPEDVRAAHRSSSPLSKTVAVTLTVTPPRTPRACR